jgi:hypothetical protein
VTGSTLFDVPDSRPPWQRPAEPAATAILRGRKHADPMWLKVALGIVRELAMTRGSFTADDVHAGLRLRPDVTTHDSRALGSVLREAAAHRWITVTDEWVQSRRPEAHARPVRRWRSLIRSDLP